MTDTVLLMQTIKDSGVTITFLATYMDCSRGRIYAILKGADCLASEIVKLSEALHLTPDTRDLIFLSGKVTDSKQ